MIDCCICSERVDLFGVGQCGHKEICAQCHYLMRVKRGKAECSVCKEINECIVITDDIHKGFKDFNVEDCSEFDQGGIFFPTEMIKRRFELQLCNKCPFPECEEKGQTFKNYLEYKKHLTSRHRKYLW
jgi:hypothetical protein